MTDFLELAKVYLPKYLTPSEKRDLWEELRKFPTIDSFYLPESDDGRVLQGDGWRGLTVINFETLERRRITGLVVSNSCDIAPENDRKIPTNIVFAPLINLGQYAVQLREAGQSEEQIAAVMAAIRRQEITYLFYLPGSSQGLGESVAFLDDLHSHPVSKFLASDRTKVFRLHQVSFYVLLLKLSIHFCRFQEDLSRLA